MAYIPQCPATAPCSAMPGPPRRATPLAPGGAPTPRCPVSAAGAPEPGRPARLASMQTGHTAVLVVCLLVLSPAPIRTVVVVSHIGDVAGAGDSVIYRSIVHERRRPLAAPVRADRPLPVDGRILSGAPVAGEAPAHFREVIRLANGAPRGVCN